MGFVRNDDVGELRLGLIGEEGNRGRSERGLAPFLHRELV